MKRLSFLIVFLAATSGVALAQWAAVLSASRSSAPSYEFVETFEGSHTTTPHSLVGTDNTGWVDQSASQVFHFSPALFGAYSFAPTVTGTRADHAFVTSATTVHLFGVVKLSTTIGNGDNVFAIRAGATLIGSVNWRTGNLARCVAGSTQGSNTGAIWTPGSVYYVWLDYTNGGSGADVVTAYISTTSTKPGSATCTVTGGTSTANGDTGSTGAQTGTDAVYDNIVLDGTKVIGSNPVP